MRFDLASYSIGMFVGAVIAVSISWFLNYD